MGMLATVMNGLALRDALERRNIKTRLMSAIAINGVVEQYSSRNSIRFLKRVMSVFLSQVLVIHSLRPIPQRVCVVLKSKQN